LTFDAFLALWRSQAKPGCAEGVAPHGLAQARSGRKWEPRHRFVV
jgi:hypothetical protein